MFPVVMPNTAWMLRILPRRGVTAPPPRDTKTHADAWHRTPCLPQLSFLHGLKLYEFFVEQKIVESLQRPRDEERRIDPAVESSRKTTSRCLRLFPSSTRPSDDAYDEARYSRAGPLEARRGDPAHRRLRFSESISATALERNVSAIGNTRFDALRVSSRRGAAGRLQAYIK